MGYRLPLPTLNRRPPATAVERAGQRIAICWESPAPAASTPDTRPPNSRGRLLTPWYPSRSLTSAPTTSACWSCKGKRSATWHPTRSDGSQPLRHRRLGNRLRDHRRRGILVIQVGFVIVGHVVALVLAHDRALAVFKDAKAAVRSQYWLLAVMVGYTTLALWLLAQAREG